MPARSWSKGTDHAAQYPRRPYDNQYHRFCSVCSAHTLHAKGRKYWTCLTCDTRTERQPNKGLQSDIGESAASKPDPIEVYYPDTEQTKECGWCHQMNKESNTNCWACEGEI